MAARNRPAPQNVFDFVGRISFVAGRRANARNFLFEFVSHFIEMVIDIFCLVNLKSSRLGILMLGDAFQHLGRCPVNLGRLVVLPKTANLFFACRVAFNLFKRLVAQPLIRQILAGCHMRIRRATLVVIYKRLAFQLFTAFVESIRFIALVLLIDRPLF